MKNYSKLFCVGSIFFATIFSCHAAKQSPAKKLSHLPAPVQKTIREFLGDGKLGGIEKTDEDGEISYDAEISKDGKTRSITVDAEGELVYVEVFLPETPDAVQKTIQTQLGTEGKLGDIFKAIDDDDISYEVGMSRGGTSRDFTVGTDGKLIDMEVSLAETPVAVQKTIREQANGEKISLVTKTFDEDGIAYDVEISKDKSSRNITIDSDGAFISEEVALSATPEAVQKTVQAQLGDGKVLGIDKYFDDKEISFEVELKKEDKTEFLSIAADGKITE